MHYSDQGYKEKKRARSRGKTAFSRQKISYRAEKIDIVQKKVSLFYAGSETFLKIFPKNA